MAKRRTPKTVVEMETEMGFQLSRLEEGLSGSRTASSGPLARRLFSNMHPVPSDLRELTEKEHQEFSRGKHASESKSMSLGHGQTKIVVYHGDCVILGHDSGPGSSRFPVGIHYGFGLDLAFLFPESEASHVLCAAKIRQAIYKFALPRVDWAMVDDEEFEHNDFPRGIGDPSGFHFPLSNALSVPRLNKQIRREALPFSYRQIKFCFHNLESATKFLIAHFGAYQQLGHAIAKLLLAGGAVASDEFGWRIGEFLYNEFDTSGSVEPFKEDSGDVEGRFRTIEEEEEEMEEQRSLSAQQLAVLGKSISVLRLLMGQA
ncbi:hypothetical protein Micbo1qcDRAFT_196823 [Microdochium bolleyi]|uniref:Uncharacterized protein n=1 Tax=Microdochium bolleyi TaxID=196109 RepID=A0A136IX89_9PEZI|nr:hypothetical protein Micbo1qcDRAFT_196823 [Microdochium bolleyi]